MSKAQIAKLQAQLKALPPGSPAAKALSAAIERARLQTAQTPVKTRKSPPEVPPANLIPILPSIPEVPPAPEPPVPEVLPKCENPPVSINVPEAPPASTNLPSAPPHPQTSRFYQAVGNIAATLKSAPEGGYCLEWQGRDWPVHLRRDLLSLAPKLLGKSLYWRVYPTIQHTIDKHRVHYFQILKYSSQADAVINDQFKLSGCWQVLPHWQTPDSQRAYFTVYRNQIKDSRSQRQYSNYSLHWPQQHPSVLGEGEQAPWHSILAKLNNEGVFEFVELLEGPHPSPPRAQLWKRRKFSPQNCR